MGVVTLKRNWLKKPEGIFEIDWDNPLTEGLEHLYIATDGGMYDLVEQRFISNPHSSAFYNDTEEGMFQDYDGINLEYDVIESRDRQTSTLGCVGFVDTRTDDDRLVGLGNSTTTTPINLIGINDYGAGFRIRDLFRTDGSVSGTVDNVVTHYPGEYLVITAANGGGLKQRLKVNDEAIVEGSVDADAASTVDRIAFAGIRRTADAAQLDCKLGLVWLYEISLPDDFIDRLNQNPWQLLKPRAIYLPTIAAGGGATIPVFVQHFRNQGIM